MRFSKITTSTQRLNYNYNLNQSEIKINTVLYRVRIMLTYSHGKKGYFMISLKKTQHF